MLRRLIDDFREFPATMALCSLWVIVFALMVIDQIAQGHIPSLGTLVLGIRGGHAFGELTISALFQGEIWRPLTATFVHYGLLHIGMNLLMMYQLGAVVETWYGPWQFVAVYVVIGYGGNLLSALVRSALGSDPLAASGGGSTVILGLVALCAVVGWRSRTRIGAFLGSQMGGLLIATALIGQMVPIIDNWGHAGGALVGALIALAHRTLIRTVRLPVAKWSGCVSVGLLIAAGGAQVREAFTASSAMSLAVSRWKAAEKTPQTLKEIGGFYHLAARRSWFEHAPRVEEAVRRARSDTMPQAATSRPSFVRPLSLLDSTDEEFRVELKRQLELLDGLANDLGSGPTAATFSRLRILLARVLTWPPSDLIVREFDTHLGALIQRAQQNQDSARTEIQELRNHACLRPDLTPARSTAARPAGGGDVPFVAAAHG